MANLKVRKVKLKDKDWILEIMNQRSVQKLFFFYHSGIIKPKENEIYWRRKLKDRKFKAYAIISDHRPAGLIKIDKGAVGIVVDERHRRKGLAYSALRKLNLKNCTAEIKPHNKTSQKLFKKLGFVEFKRIYRFRFKTK